MIIPSGLTADISTNVSSRRVFVAGILNVTNNGVLNIDGNTLSNGLANTGTTTNDGVLNLGLNAPSLGAAIANNGDFTNNGSINTGQFGFPGGAVISSTGNFTNMGDIDIAPSSATFGILTTGAGTLFTNQGSISVNGVGQGLRIINNSVLLNEGFINLNSGGLALADGTFTNTACAEIYTNDINISTAASSVDNAGLISVANNSSNQGIWNNSGTIGLSNGLNAGSNPINNSELIIEPKTFLENCGQISPAFTVGANLGSNLSVFTDASATLSAGTYDETTNTFTTNFPVNIGVVYNLFVKVEDNNNVCNDYILPWELTGAATMCDNDMDGFNIAQGDCDDNNADVNPNQTEILFDGLDNDCNPATLDYDDVTCFADEVVSNFISPDCPTGVGFDDPIFAVGPPNYSGEVPFFSGTFFPGEFYSMGSINSEVTLRFVDNALINDGSSADDLYIYEVGPLVEQTEVWLLPSNMNTETILLNIPLTPDADGFFFIGTVVGATSVVDIDQITTGLAGGDLVFNEIF